MARNKYFEPRKGKINTVVGIFLALLLIFSIAYFLWSLMQYNESMKQKEEKEEYIAQLQDDIQRLEYMVDAPLDDAFKIRVAREKLGMCFPDEVIYYGEYDSNSNN